MSSQCSQNPNQAAEDQARDQRLQAALDNIRFKILVMSGKGGVGKSTVSAYLALGLAAKGYSVGLMDVDMHGPSIPRLLGVESNAEVQEEQGRIRPVPYNRGLRLISVEVLMPNREGSVIWRGPLKIGVIKQFLSDVDWGPLDFLVVDSPPGTGDEPLTVAQTVDGALALVVTTPQEIALADVRKSLDFCRQVQMPILGIVENMNGLICPHCGEPINIYGKDGGGSLADKFKLRLMGSLPMDPRLVTAGDQGKPLDLMQDQNGAGPAWQELVNNVLKNTIER